MPTEENSMEKVKKLLFDRSKNAIEVAKKAVLSEHLSYGPLGDALGYFMEEIWCNSAHPALISLTCEAVGGKPEATTNISAALVVLTGAADIHDDIIDKSETKAEQATIFGKYGADIAIIAGNVLWFKGMLMLNEACDSLEIKKKLTILELAKRAFFDIGSMEAREANLRRNLDLQPQEYLDIIKMKVSVAQTAAKIGAIVGDGTIEEIETLGEFGKTLGTLMTIRDEFADLFEIDELKNRFENECLPLPILYAFQDAMLKKRILEILRQKEITVSELDKLLDLIINSSDVHKLGKYMHLIAREGTQSLAKIKKNKNVFNQLLKSTLEDLPC